MSKQKKLIYSLILLFNDVLMLIASLIFAVKIRRDHWPIENRPILATDYYEISYVVIGVFVFAYMFFSLYRNESEKPFYKNIGRIIAANIGGAFILMSMSFALKSGWLLSRSVLLIFVLANIFLSILSRNALGSGIFTGFSKLFGSKNILIVGSGKLGFEFLDRLTRYKDWGFNIVGFVDTENQSAYSEIGATCQEKHDIVKGVCESFASSCKNIENCANLVRENSLKCIGKIEEFEELTGKYHIDEVVVALPYEKYHYMKEIISICDKEGIRIRIVPGYYEYLQVSTRVEDLDGMPILNIREVPLDLMVNKLVKRSFDIFFSSMALILFSPIMLTVAIGVKLSSPGPVLFRQERVGVNNRKFMMLKFRSMRLQNNEEEKSQWTTADDPRKTRFGSFIRKTSLDELPQLFNVLKGDMSIVGPRPERPYWVDKFKEEIPEYMLRHYIKSGITGWAQVNGWRGDTSIEERIKCDNYYIYNWSLWLDIKIIIMTVFKGFVNKNAY